MDGTRNADLEILYKGLHQAETLQQRQIIEKIINNIHHEDEFERKYREQLVRAVKANDKYSIKKISEILFSHRQQKVNGRQF
jgi:hypothetical protein